MLSHLVYISKREPKCTDEEIEKILRACQENNSKIDTTGVLLYTDKQFVQYLEGEYKKIMGLYDKIKGDERHKKVALITSGPIKERLFPSWEMGSKELDFNNIQYNSNITLEDKVEFDKIMAGEETTRAMTVIKKLFK